MCLTLFLCMTNSMLKKQQKIIRNFGLLFLKGEGIFMTYTVMTNETNFGHGCS